MLFKLTDTLFSGEITSCSSGSIGVGYEGNSCSFTCNTGYELIGSDTIGSVSMMGVGMVMMMCVKRLAVCALTAITPNILYNNVVLCPTLTMG